MRSLEEYIKEALDINNSVNISAEEIIQCCFSFDYEEKSFAANYVKDAKQLIEQWCENSIVYLAESTDPDYWDAPFDIEKSKLDEDKFKKKYLNSKKIRWDIGCHDCSQVATFEDKLVICTCWGDSGDWFDIIFYKEKI